MNSRSRLTTLFKNRSLSKLQTPFTTWTERNFSQESLPWRGSELDILRGWGQLTLEIYSSEAHSSSPRTLNNTQTCYFESILSKSQKDGIPIHSEERKRCENILFYVIQVIKLSGRRLERTEALVLSIYLFLVIIVITRKPPPFSSLQQLLWKLSPL